MTESQKNKKILLAHGGGGRLTSALIENNILPKFKNDILAQLADAATIKLDSPNVCFTTDSYVVKPLAFNGGDIGKLAVCGTVNDLAVAGCKPCALSLSLIIEEGFEFDMLEKILTSAADTASDAGVPVVTGDTKVVEKGAADGIFINTAGLGTVIPGTDFSLDRIKPGDKIIINGTIGDHGMTIITQRENLTLSSPLQSDCACLHELIADVLTAVPEVKFMRDPTRGGLAATLNEIAKSARCSIEIEESSIPINPSVQAVADILGFDLLNVANEGKVVIVAPGETADKVVAVLKAHPLGKDAAVIGSISRQSDKPIVQMLTKIGGTRIVQTPYGRELPRIC